MNDLISGVHHVSLKCSSPEEFSAAKEFYGSVLGLRLLREGSAGILFDTGAGMIEIFSNGTERLPQGAIRHFAFLVPSADACIEKVRAAGYAVTSEPRDVEMDSVPPYPLRVAFCIGPMGEEIEFFQER